MSDFFMSYSDDDDDDNQGFFQDENLSFFQNDNQDGTLNNQYCFQFDSYEDKKETNQIDNISLSENKDSNNQITKSRKKPKPYHKRKSTLSDQAQCFREIFFLIFTKKKKFPKTIIWEIHKHIQ